MKKILTFLMFFLLSFSLVAAVEVSPSKTDYSSGEMVTMTIADCIGTSIVKFLNPSGTIVDIRNGEDGRSASYNTLSDSADGKYAVYATCTNGAAQTNFCVDAPGCVQVAQQPGVPGVVAGGGTSTGGSSGGRAGTSDNLGGQVCRESWTCSVWTECSAGLQSRVCYDENSCGTTDNKPALEKGCNQADPLPQPVQISVKLPPPRVPMPAVTQQSFLSKLWDNYNYYILGALAAIVLVVIILLIIHFFVPKKVAYNINELKQWVKKEKEMGTSDVDIREILKQNTGWTDEEIDLAFEGLKVSLKPESDTGQRRSL